MYVQTFLPTHHYNGVWGGRFEMYVQTFLPTHHYNGVWGGRFEMYVQTFLPTHHYNGVWGGRFERTFFDVRVFNPFAKSNMDTPLATTYRRHENDKRRQYEQRVIQVEHSSFVPLVFSATGGMSKSTSNFYRHLALKLSVKRDEHLSVILSLLHCRLSFALLRAAIMCIRGVRSSRHKPLLNSPFDLQVAESRLSFS